MEKGLVAFAKPHTTSWSAKPTNPLSHIVAELRPFAYPILNSVLDYVRQAILVMYPNVRTLKSSYNTIKISVRYQTVPKCSRPNSD